MVAYSSAKWCITVLFLLLVSCSTTKQTSRSLTTDYIGARNFRLADTLDLYYFPPLRTCASNLSQTCLVNSDTSQQRPFHARVIRHATANIADTTRYQVNEQKQVTTAKQPPDPMLDTGRKILLSLIIFFGFVFIAGLVLVILKLVRLTGSQWCAPVSFCPPFKSFCPPPFHIKITKVYQIINPESIEEDKSQ